MFLTKRLRSVFIFMSVFLASLASSAAFAQSTAVTLQLEITWEETTGSDTEVAQALNSATDTWTITAELGDFDLTQPGPYQDGLYEKNLHPVHFNVVSTTSVPEGLEPATGHIGIGSADYVFNGRNDGTSPVQLTDRTLGTASFQPGYTWFFERTLYLPLGNDTDDSIIALLSTIGTQFDVEEYFLKDRVASASRVGIATVMAVDVPPAVCDIVVHSQWQDGYAADVRIRNMSQDVIEGWHLDLTLPGSATISNSWNATLSGAGPFFSASNLDWNGNIQPDQEVTFGIMGPITTVAHAISDTQISSAICQ